MGETSIVNPSNVFTQVLSLPSRFRGEPNASSRQKWVMSGLPLLLALGRLFMAAWCRLRSSRIRLGFFPLFAALLMTEGWLRMLGGTISRAASTRMRLSIAEGKIVGAAS